METIAKTQPRPGHQPDTLSETFAALADPTRRAILSRLSMGTATVGELAEPFVGTMSLPAITKHIGVLQRAGLVSKTRDAQWRTCALHGPGLQVATEWLDAYRVFWEAQFDRLEEYLQTITAVQPKKGKRNARKNRR